MSQILSANRLWVVLMLAVVSCAPSQDKKSDQYVSDVGEFAARDYAEHQKQVEAHQNQRFGFGGQANGDHGSHYSFQDSGNPGELSFTFSDSSDHNRKHVRDRGYGFEKAYAYSRETAVVNLDDDKAAADFLSLVEGRDIGREVQEKASQDISKHGHGSEKDLNAEEQVHTDYSK